MHPNVLNPFVIFVISILISIISVIFVFPRRLLERGFNDSIHRVFRSCRRDSGSSSCCPAVTSGSSS